VEAGRQILSGETIGVEGWYPMVRVVVSAEPPHP